MWAGSANSDVEGYNPLHRSKGQGSDIQAPHLGSSKISASLIAQDRDGSAAGQWYSDNTFFFNLSLTGRPASARGRFEAMDGDYRPVGDLFFIPAGQRYLAKGGPGHQRNLFLEMYADERLRDEQEFDVEMAPVLQTCMNMPFDRLRDLLLRIVREVGEPGFASEFLIEGLGLTLLAETLRVLHRVEANAARKGGMSPWRMRAIESRVRDGHDIPTLAELADLCGLSRRQLMRAFREETGQTVGFFIQNLTLERAKLLLRQTNMPIAEVAAQVGFTTPASFSTAFRRSLGESPRRFRSSRGKS
jgi:AraC family transcriptional regulator